MDVERNRPDDSGPAHNERLARLALYLGLNGKAGAFHRVLALTGSAEAAFGRDLRVLGMNLTPLLTGGLFEEAAERLDYAQQHGLDIIILGDGNYPLRLAELDEPPPVLWVRGTLEAADQFAVALVGSREASAHGLEFSRRLARSGAMKGLTIVSGLARGVDTQAHRGALEAGGRTLAVLGCGLDHIYPKENARLYDEIAAQGALISEFTPETTPFPANFPRRNRVIAGLSLAVVVTEARERSGALITARLALEMNREVMALPGPAGLGSARGANLLIKNGAALVESMDEVLAEIKPRLLEGLSAPLRAPIEFEDDIIAEPPPSYRKSTKNSAKTKAGLPPKQNSATVAGLSAQAKSATLAGSPPQPEPELAFAADTPEGRIWAALKQSPRDTDSLVRATGLGAAETAVALLNLELTGRVLRLASGQFEAQ
ncbi:MAG: DNA-processing protein DprA [Candidatus Adiutrix sp.]|jgi:DNA protecting protein DprA|nr:DNA-processing protein DprA [Candidatus Adiutrix sp.]